MDCTVYRYRFPACPGMEQHSHMGLFENPSALQRLSTSASRRPCRQLRCPAQSLSLEKICVAGLILLAVTLSACGGGGGGGGSAPAKVPVVQPPPTEAPPFETPENQDPVISGPPPEPPPQLQPQPMLPSDLLPDPPNCIRTDNMGCLEPDEYQDEVDFHAVGYREHRNFKNQWGLSAIHADRAYAHVELIKGQGIAPGNGCDGRICRQRHRPGPLVAGWGGHRRGVSVRQD